MAPYLDLREELQDVLDILLNSSVPASQWRQYSAEQPTRA